MTEPTPAVAAKAPPAVVISTVRTITPLLVTIVAGLLAKAHVTAVDNTTLSTGIDWALGGIVGLAWTFGVRLLETKVAPWWGRLFIVAKAPAYAPGPAPAAAPPVVDYVPQHLGPQPPTDGTATAGISGIDLLISVAVSVGAVLLIALAWGLPAHH